MTGLHPPAPEAKEPRPPSPAAGVSRRGPVIALAVVGSALLATGALAIAMLSTERSAEPPTLAAVVVLEDQAIDHVTGDVDYDRDPPAGGPHDRDWHACGVYDAPIRPEHAVHSLEHGTVWITHRPDLDDSDVGALAATLPHEGILSPHLGQDAPVMVTVWGRQLALDGADDPRLRLFLEEFGDGHTSPEPSASCEGGVRPPDSDSVPT